MRRVLFFLVVAIIVGYGTAGWCQCPGQPDDLGECDTLIAEALDNGLVSSFPANVPLMLRVTHDLFNEDDSLAGFVIPITITGRTNPAKYCSVSLYWNQTAMADYFPNFSRSVFRHIGSIQNRMALLESDFSDRGWDYAEVELGDEVSQFFFITTPTGSKNQRWWEGTQVLLATATFHVEDTMTICVDSTWWYPSSTLKFVDPGGNSFVPRHNFPYCFKVDTIPPNDVREIPGSDESRPSEFSLSQNYPNPFNPFTNIQFTVLRSSQVKLEIFNIVGQKVKTLVDQQMKPGTYLADWDGKDESGESVSSGIYFYRMQADDFSDMKKMLLVK